MKEIIYMSFILIVISVFICLLCGCNDTVLLEPPEPTVGEKDNDDIYIWTDEETGVQYIIYREKCYNAGFVGITPRLNPDGSLYLVENQGENLK